MKNVAILDNGFVTIRYEYFRELVADSLLLEAKEAAGMNVPEDKNLTIQLLEYEIERLREALGDIAHHHAPYDDSHNFEGQCCDGCVAKAALMEGK